MDDPRINDDVVKDGKERLHHDEIYIRVVKFKQSFQTKKKEKCCEM
jgi:hypothetical protein